MDIDRILRVSMSVSKPIYMYIGIMQDIGGSRKVSSLHGTSIILNEINKGFFFLKNFSTASSGH